MSLHRIAGPQAAAVTGVKEVLAALLKSGIAGFAFTTAQGVVIEAEIRLLSSVERDPRPRRPRSATRLTGRQIEVLRLIARGGSNKEIARELGLSPATVKAHTAAAIAVLGAANRTEAVMRACEMRLI